ncbi:minor head protein inhibitor of protease [Aeromonas phage GomatiRiver_11]|nr:hypothetical protein OBDJBBDK_00255 [Aeromonas phage AhFM11]WKW84419.1 minor head protein inhibitor of protease [Aeromonas phage GomatiRiver_11]
MAKKPVTFSRSDLEIQYGKMGAVEGKKKLAEYALKNFGVKLNRTKTIPNMLNDLEEEVGAAFKAAQDTVGDAEEQIDMNARVDLSDAIELNPDAMDEDEDDDSTPSHIAVEEFQSVTGNEPVPIADLEPEVKAEIVEAIKTGKVVIEAPIKPVANIEPAKAVAQPKTTVTLTFPEDYKPKYKLIGPEGRAFINIPYWVYDWMQGRDWRTEISECPFDKEILKSLAFYIERDGSVAIRESRNSKFIVIS